MTASPEGGSGLGGSPGFLLLWGAQSISTLGASSASFVLGLQVFGDTGSAVALAVLTVMSSTGNIYLAPLAGAFADRIGHRRAAILANVVLAIVSAGMFTASLIGPGRLLGVVYPLVLVSAIAASTLTLTLTASVRRMRQDADLTRINGVTTLLQRAPVIVAPVVGAALYATVAPASVFLVDGLTSLGCVAALLVVRWDAPPAPGPRRANPFPGAREGIAWILRHRGIRDMQIGFAGLNLFNGLGVTATTAYVILLAGRQWGSASGLAAYTVSAAIGLVAGAAVVAWRGDRIPRLVAITCMPLVLGLVGRASLGVTDALVLVVAAGFVRNAAIQLQGAPLAAVWQESAPPAQQGSILGGARLLGQGPYPFAVLAGGGLIALLAPLGQEEAMRVVLVIAGVGEAACGLGMLGSRHVRALFA
ncbi:MFS transporter [Clavibacter sp. VKM Ac-2873]|nr:MFS transporter [Clavibacter sp. VKM Ac-2873]